MLALAAGYFLVAYLLAPGAIYRLVFSYFIPSKRFQRTRTEEVVFSVLAVVGPFLLSWILLCHSPIGRFPCFGSWHDKIAAYDAVVLGLVSDGHPPVTIIGAYTRVLQEQARFVFYLWVLCGLEGWICGKIVIRYGSYSDTSNRFCDKFLLRHVSEWQILFTTITLPEVERGKMVEIDALSADTLYTGRLVNWFTDQDGNLAGIFLKDAFRFQRDNWNRDVAADKAGERESYWREIPGANLYVVASSISNYNIRYVTEEAHLASILRRRFGNDTTVTKVTTV